ncbi:response regulator [Pseudaminobacter arsenicus]|uniref:response regulator n=1 Tax=Borborobacter arsenicus TaxID=1851146 RepID=UPI001404965F
MSGLPDNDQQAAPPEIDVHRALVVGRSPINRVVVSKIVERSGLKPIAETPEAAMETLRRIVPGTVILDGGASNKDCDGLMAQLATLRRMSGGKMPCVILLSTRVGCGKVLQATATIDAVVAKPITPEQLQPVVERLLESQGGCSGTT